jgi:hypothetical protein
VRDEQFLLVTRTAATESVSLCVSISSKLHLCDSRIADNVKKRGWSLRWVLSGATRVSKEKFSFLSGLEIQREQTRRFIELSAMKVNPLLLVVIPLFFLSGPYVNAGPVGDFFKKVGQSISKPLQPQSTRPQPTKTPHATPRPTSRAAPAAAVTPPGVAQPSHPSKEKEFTGTVRRVSAADMEKAKAGLPYGIPVPGRKGMVTSPYVPEQGKCVDVTDFAPGSIVKDPYPGKFFLVP